jgi:hypothetical protein
MTSDGHAHSRFRRALLTKNVNLIDAAVRELQHVGLDDALRILVCSPSAETIALNVRRRVSRRG